jgi:hypothetical protein
MEGLRERPFIDVRRGDRAFEVNFPGDREGLALRRAVRPHNRKPDVRVVEAGAIREIDVKEGGNGASRIHWDREMIEWTTVASLC